MPEPNVVSWTSLMAGYVGEGQPEMARWLFQKMQGSLVLPNESTFATVINACSVLANLKIGRNIQAHLEVMGFESNLLVCSSLIDMYGKCNEVDKARLIFDSMNCRNIVSWTSMITAYAQNAQGFRVLQLFREFSHWRLESPDHFFLGIVINACASLGSLVSGKIAYGEVIRPGHDTNSVISSALVDMHAKCGCVDYSYNVFQRTTNPSVIDYTSMIVGPAECGLGTMSLELFQEMIDLSIKPNDVTFIGVLHAAAILDSLIKALSC